MSGGILVCRRFRLLVIHRRITGRRDSICSAGIEVELSTLVEVSKEFSESMANDRDSETMTISEDDLRVGNDGRSTRTIDDYDQRATSDDDGELGTGAAEAR